jgi:hypothetical protein
MAELADAAEYLLANAGTKSKTSRRTEVSSPHSRQR